MKKTIRLVCMLCMLVLMLGMLGACSKTPQNEAPKQGSTQQAQQEPVVTITALAVKTMPAKTEYLLNEKFSAEGCVLTATFSDGTTKDIAIDEKGVEVTAPSTDSVGKKNVAIRYEGQRATFQINVSKEKLTATFHYNADGLSDQTVTVEKGDKVAMPAAQERENYEFGGWFSDEQCTIAYDFDSTVEQNVNIYAMWINKAATNYDFIFDLNQEGLEQGEIVQQVQEGQTAVRMSVDPTRVGYEFAGWYTEAEGGVEYDFAAPVTGSMSVYAHWNKTVSGEQTYVFEAEDTSLAGKSGPAFSGTAMETGMIVYDNKFGESNDRFVGYLYQRYNSLEFFINSDEAVTGVTLVARLSAEMRDYTYNMNNFVISVNGESLDYGDIVFTKVPKNSYSSVECLPFEDYVISTNVTLKKGMNLITLMTDNDDKMAGSTLLAAAPLVDCIKLTTSAVLTWSETMGLPAANY